VKLVAGATTALRRLLDALLVALIVIVLFGVILGKLVPVTGRQVLVVGGPSMEPALALGSAIVVRPTDAGSLAVGDVVSLRPGTDGSVFTHRVVEIADRADGRWVRTKGDANATPDPTLVPATSIIGVVEYAIPYAGYLLTLMTMPTGIVFLLGLAATLLASAWLLESLELEAADRRRAELGRAPGPVVGLSLAAGEPIARRPSIVETGGQTAAAGRAAVPFRPASAAPAGFAVSSGMSVGERIAATRATRRRRERWGGQARRASPGRD
jgi:signal peptidase